MIRAHCGFFVAHSMIVRLNMSCAPGSHDAMDNFKAAELASGIVGSLLPIWIGGAEQTRQALQSASIGSRIVDSLQYVLIVGQNIAPRPQGVEVQALRALIHAGGGIQ